MPCLACCCFPASLHTLDLQRISQSALDINFVPNSLPSTVSPVVLRAALTSSYELQSNLLRKLVELSGSNEKALLTFDFDATRKDKLAPEFLVFNKGALQAFNTLELIKLYTGVL